MDQENKCSNEIGQWIFCFILGFIFVGIGRLLFKPFEESNIFFKFFGILSIIFLLFIVFVVGLTAFGANPIHPVTLVLPGMIYGCLALISIFVRKMNEANS